MASTGSSGSGGSDPEGGKPWYRKLSDAQLETFWQIQDMKGAVDGPGILQTPDGPVEVLEGERAMLVNGIILRYTSKNLPINAEELYNRGEVMVELRLPENMMAQGIVLEVSDGPSVGMVANDFLPRRCWAFCHWGHSGHS